MTLWSKWHNDETRDWTPLPPPPTILWCGRMGIGVKGYQITCLVIAPFWQQNHGRRSHVKEETAEAGQIHSVTLLMSLSMKVSRRKSVMITTRSPVRSPTHPVQPMSQYRSVGDLWSRSVIIITNYTGISPQPQNSLTIPKERIDNFVTQDSIYICIYWKSYFLQIFVFLLISLFI